MKKPKSTIRIPATPQQVAMYGHIATALRSYMKANNLSVRAMNVKIGVTPTNTGLYNFVNAKAAPGHATRAKIAKATGIPQADLMPRSLATGGAVATVARSTMPLPVKPREVLGFTVDAVGMATLTLNATLPLDAATPLLRILLDAGLVFTKPE